MGFETRSEGRYFTILGGKFCQRVGEKTEGAIPRINKLGKQVFEKFYDSFTGQLVNIKVQDGNGYGKNWIFVFKDGEDVWNLQLGYSNSYATNILKMLPNIDINKPFKLSPQVKEVDGKSKSSLFINQGEQHIKHAYTRENPNGMPDLEQVVVKGDTVWDDTKRLIFLQEMVNRDILPKLSKEAIPASEGSIDEVSVGTGEAINPDDIPF